MPNHVTNIVAIVGESERVKGIMQAIKSEKEGRENLFDFDKIIPMPSNLHITSGSQVSNCMALIKKKSKTKEDKENLERFKITKSDFMSENGRTVFEEANMAIENEKLYGCKDWYDWSCQYWGTKWNSYDHEQIDESVVKFDTAWSTPEPVIKALSLKYPDVEIYVGYADEDFGYNVGIYSYCNGEAGTDLNFSKTTLGIKLAEKLKGYNPYDEDGEEPEGFEEISLEDVIPGQIDSPIRKLLN